MHVPFTKMHGLGNDFVLIRGDDVPLPSPERIRLLADRRRGIGFDQLLWIEAAKRAGDDIHYRIFNTDGSEAEQCGNGARCIARLVARPGQQDLRLGHGTGSVRARLEADGTVSVEMAVPEFRPALVPFKSQQQALRYDLSAGADTFEVGVVSMGNPHAVLQVDDVESAPVQRLGPLLERHERFPNRANIGFMQVIAPNRIRLRVFERGVGETAACGTGACAAVVVGRAWSLLEPQVTVELPGGTLQIRWQGPGHPVWMTGEAVTVFEGMVQV
jgi:diaminopimelate epimerase